MVFYCLFYCIYGIGVSTNLILFQQQILYPKYKKVLSVHKNTRPERFKTKRNIFIGLSTCLLLFQLEGRPYQYLPPNQTPISPPYEEALSLDMKRGETVIQLPDGTNIRSSSSSATRDMAEQLHKVYLEDSGK